MSNLLDNMTSEERDRARGLYGMVITPPSPKEVIKIKEMLKQVEIWINLGEKELAEKHWALIADECLKMAHSK